VVALSSFLSGDHTLLIVLSFGSLLAVCVPLWRGARLCLQARAATRRLERAELEKRVQRPPGEQAEPLGLVTLRVLRKSLEEGGEAYPTEFVIDASRQYAAHQYDASYASLISMYANLLPPIGFIGTTSGLLILFLSLHLADTALELGALALALTSSIFALIGFALLESLKIRLYGRLMRCLSEVTEFHLHKLEKRKPV
jgi:hypothetical protein